MLCCRVMSAMSLGSVRLCPMCYVSRVHFALPSVVVTYAMARVFAMAVRSAFLSRSFPPPCVAGFVVGLVVLFVYVCLCVGRCWAVCVWEARVLELDAVPCYFCGRCTPCKPYLVFIVVYSLS